MTGSMAARRRISRFDLRCQLPLLACRVDLEAIVGRRVVATIAGIDVEPLDRVADELLDCRDDLGEGVAIMRIAGKRLHMGGELASLGVL